jgi:hypothetical protein
MSLNELCMLMGRELVKSHHTTQSNTHELDLKCRGMRKRHVCVNVDFCKVRISWASGIRVQSPQPSMEGFLKSTNHGKYPIKASSSSPTRISSIQQIRIRGHRRPICSRRMG